MNDLIIATQLLHNLFMFYNVKKEVSGILKGSYVYSGHSHNPVNVFVYDCLFFKNKQSTERQASWKYRRDAFGYFHSHISGNLNLSLADKLLLFLFWILGQNLSLVYGKCDQLFVLIFYKFTLKGIKEIKRVEYNFLDLFNQISGELVTSKDNSELRVQNEEFKSEEINKC